MGIPVVVTHALDGQQVEFTLDFSEGSLAETLAAIHAELEEGERCVRSRYVLISPSRGAYLTAETGWRAARGGRGGRRAAARAAPAVEVRDQLQQLRSPRWSAAKKKLVFNLKKRLTAPEFSEGSSRRTGSRRCSSSSTTRRRHRARLGCRYTLLALRQVLCWQSDGAAVRLGGADGLALPADVLAPPQVDLARLELLFVFCNFVDSRHSFTRVLSAASATARAHDDAVRRPRPPPELGRPRRQAERADADQLLISCAPGRHERERLIFQLDRLRVNESLLESVDRDDLGGRSSMSPLGSPASTCRARGTRPTSTREARDLALELEDARRSLDLFRLEQPLSRCCRRKCSAPIGSSGARANGACSSAASDAAGRRPREGPLQLNLLARAGTLASVEAADPVALWA